MTHTKTSSLAFISLQTCFPNFQLNQKSRGMTAPLAPLLPTPMHYVAALRKFLGQFIPDSGDISVVQDTELSTKCPEFLAERAQRAQTHSGHDNRDLRYI